MAATPPFQITATPHTPPTPLHGATYDYEDSPRRFSARLRQKRALEVPSDEQTSRPSRSARTPNTPRTSTRATYSPGPTPQRKTTGRRIQVASPPSPDSDSSAPKPTTSRSDLPQPRPLLSATTTMTQGMLPTPVKTPNKKQKIIKNSNLAARALFQEQNPVEDAMPSPRKNRKTKRYNGFSLESFRAGAGDDEGQEQIQIFTDSRDKVPDLDPSPDNPFVEVDRRGASSKRVAGTSKRRKVSEPRKMDPQVEEALEKDEGMVYTFRGKKIYRRFDDTGEEEEDIDADDLGLLQHTADGARIVKPLKTLTRKSIRPMRLFQTEAQRRARELEKEEEALTDVEEETHEPETELRAEDAIRAAKGKGKAPVRPVPSVKDRMEKGTDGKKGSPFDSWPRVKPGSGGPAGVSRATRGRKRAASSSPEESLATQA